MTSDAPIQLITVPNTWQSGAPLSTATRAGDLLFLSGAVSVDPETGEAVGGDIDRQTRQTISNLERTLVAVGLSLDAITKVTVFLTDIALAPAMNAAYREAFRGHLPARSTVQVGPLARPEFLIEIEAIAYAAPD